MTDSKSQADINAELAKKHVLANFKSLTLWNSRWGWNWSSKSEPIDIRGYCTGDSNPLKIVVREMQCDYPVEIKKIKRQGEQISGVNDVAIVCSRGKGLYHEPIRGIFQDIKISDLATSKEIDEVALSKIKEAILRERDKKIRRELLLLNILANLSILFTPTSRPPIQNSEVQGKRKILAAALFVLGVMIAFLTNVASNSLPESIAPYVWLSWPLLFILSVISMILMFKQ